ncbi:hypothetical protein J2I47_11800 [Fibrella sp. HMF5335]|uniref:Outer membrane protein beta-barrel domain-containing protein n=1 Tax=Fibrella rubiginis TaxID=2817060 RepID=A0A939GIV3_9BACT|nr:hypothetical protein [Fibrella rubiginis]MBO0937233.1 hypothetical protein [Fibrella rubiginis]
MLSNRMLLCLWALLGSMAAAQAQFPVTKQGRPFVNYTELGGLFGRVAYAVNTWNGSGDEQVDNKLSLTIQTFNGVQVCPRLAVGGVVAVDWYSAALLLPVGAGLRYDLTKPNDKNVRVFVSADAGYGLNWLNKSSTNNEVKGGLMVNPGIGMRLGKPGKGAFVLSLSYKRQAVQAQKPLQWNDISRDESRVYNRLAVRVGVMF